MIIIYLLYLLTMELEIYTDGSCRNNGKTNATGAIAVYFPNSEYQNITKRYPQNNKEEIITITSTNNNKQDILEKLREDVNKLIDNYIKLSEQSPIKQKKEEIKKEEIKKKEIKKEEINDEESMEEVVTNQKMELKAIHKGLKIIDIEKHKKIKIYTDSMYSINCLTKWNKKWEKNNWRTATGEIKNLTIIKNILKQIKKIEEADGTVEFEHVRSHTNKKDEKSKNNDIVDKMAQILTK